MYAEKHPGNRSQTETRPESEYRIAIPLETDPIHIFNMLERTQLTEYTDVIFVLLMDIQLHQAALQCSRHAANHQISPAPDAPALDNPPRND